MKKILIGTVALLFLLAGCGQKKESAEPSKDTTTEALQSTLPVLENANNNTVVTRRLFYLLTKMEFNRPRLLPIRENSS